jgi:uncharacterized protein (DUF362 family)
MAAVTDRLIGLYHFLFDRTPPGLPEVEPRKRLKNPWLKDGMPAVARVPCSGKVREAIVAAIGLLGNLNQVIRPGDSVLVKPNFNSPDPPPASTDPAFLRAVVEILLESGARVTIGESSGGLWRPTRNVFRLLNVHDMARQLNVKLIAFEDEPVDQWVRVKVNGDFLSSLAMPRSAYEADHLVYVPCLKTHKMAGFTGALKLAFGFVHPGERRAFHREKLRQKLAEVSLCWQPTLIIMDGRKSFISGGPDRGCLAEPGIVMASGDAVAIDIEAIKVLLSFRGKTSLASDPWQDPQIATAVRHGLGCPNRRYTLVEGIPGKSATAATLFEDFLASGDSLRAYHGGELIFSSKKDRLAPLLDYIEQVKPPKPGVVVFDRITGNAAALLLQKIDCREVYAALGSRLAAETLDKFGISYHFTRTVEYITDKNGTDMCPMEKLSLGKSPDDFFAAVTNLLTITKTQRSKN